MKGFNEFLKMTALGGLCVLLPLLLVYMLLAEVFQAVVALATPIADLFPGGMFNQVKFPVLIALVLLVGVSFLIGLASRFALANRLGRWIERTTLSRIPPYNVLKSLTNALTVAEEGSEFKPALLHSADGVLEFAFVIEDHDDGQMTVFVARSPTPFVGSVKIARRDQVELLEVNPGDFTEMLSHWGMGARELMSKDNSR